VHQRIPGVDNRVIIEAHDIADYRRFDLFTEFPEGIGDAADKLTFMNKFAGLDLGVKDAGGTGPYPRRVPDNL
jgi:hypothetical protein